MRLTKKLAAIPFTLLCLSVLSGCNGASGDNEDPDTGGNYSLALSFKTVENGVCAAATDTQSFDTTDSFCAVAQLTQDSSNRSGKLISFAASFGELSAPNKLTDSNGLAEVIISNAAGTENAGTLAANFAEGEATADASRNYEFTQSTAPSEPTFTLNSAILNGTNVVTQFKADETVQLQAQFLDEQGQGVAGKKATFTAGSANLNPSSALTKENGIAQVSYTPTDSELGAANMSVTLEDNDKTYQSSGLYEVLAKDAVSDDGIIVIGYFEGDTFNENSLATTLPLDNGSYTVSAGGTFGITADLASKNDDGSYTRLQTPTSVNFSSSCVQSNNASIDSPVTTLSGTASTTYQNTSCSGNSERDDQIIATVTAGNRILTATLDFTLASQTLANLSFVSAEPASLRIKGAGGTGSSESSLITFKVSDANGQVIAQQQVDFSLDTTVGGISFANSAATTTSTSNSAGLVSATVLSGTVPTPVRVVATATNNSESVTSQSEQLTINTGLPQQLGFSVSADLFNPEAGDFNGEKVSITAYASDSFGNPAPDDTTINFTAEGGQIVSNCLTVNGTCSVEWTSANARVPEHRITVLAYALGHETFFDTNGNNVFDNKVTDPIELDDGSKIIEACLKSNGDTTVCSGNGMDIETYHSEGFVDLGDAFRDDNENKKYDLGEPYFNTSSNSEYVCLDVDTDGTCGDNKFNGPQCQTSDIENGLCGQGQANKTYIRKALILTMSGSQAHFEILQDGVTIYSDGDDASTITTNAIAAGASSIFSVRFFDSANQIMPAKTTLTTTASQGELDSDLFEVPNRNGIGGNSTSFMLSNDIDPASGEADKTSSVSIEVVTPKAVKSTIGFGVELTGT
ncbi:Ig-like domain-containing protein [Shewanella abyssi]|uniref:Ig-like domain-containing protein n=1 Tax=Shewanella abyssi TaxID=311789 RepID=UPI00200CD6F0|nr:Ig-like domain-containing protein [Shewanella abyssi]MCL1050088.1 Ig-like domain-containing protein [Shewanella abyssi]